MPVSRLSARAHRGSVTATLGIAFCAGCGYKHASAEPRPVTAAPTACTATLLAHTAAYDSAHIFALVGRYRLVSVDTVSTRRPELLSRELRAKRKLEVQEFRLWRANQPPAESRPRRFGELWSGPVQGAMSGRDSADFGPDRPQLQVGGRAGNELRIVYDPIVYDAVVMDGGDLTVDLPIAVLGPWGFGGPYIHHSQFYLKDLDGKPIPPFAGYYCALRIE